MFCSQLRFVLILVHCLDIKPRQVYNSKIVIENCCIGYGQLFILIDFYVQEDICEDSASFDLSSVDLATAIEETTRLGVHLTDLVSRDAIISETDDSASGK